jgi:hypothetical protein
MVNQFNGKAWGKWASLVGTVGSEPSCISDGAGTVICAATTTNGKLQVAIFNRTGCPPEQSEGYSSSLAALTHYAARRTNLRTCFAYFWDTTLGRFQLLAKGLNEVALLGKRADELKSVQKTHAVSNHGPHHEGL